MQMNTKTLWLLGGTINYSGYDTVQAASNGIVSGSIMASN